MELTEDIKQLISKHVLIAGLDEAGRGPLAGPVVAAAVMLNPQKPITGLTDSKKLSEKKREALFREITEQALCYGVGQSDHKEIDAINILQASLLAMQRAYSQLTISPTLALIDGNKSPQLACETHAIVKGDNLVAEISAASILAKVTRDRWMKSAHERYPGYGFDKHKGYPTKAHREAIQQLGPCAIHRLSFQF